MRNLFKHQQDALGKLRAGSILVGGVGSGKSRVSLAYYEKAHKKKKLYIITTAKKRDSFEWEEECRVFSITNATIDSWNNIKKYLDVSGAFFIFDEQKVIGSGAWVKSFIKLTKSNDWILLSATPGDTWMDYIPVFVANGFYKNRTDFIRRHVIFCRNIRYPKVERYIDVWHLKKLRDSITVNMSYEKKTVLHHEWIDVPYDKEAFDTVMKKRWNSYEKRPIKDASEYYYLMRKVVNSDPRRLYYVMELLDVHPRCIVFYNFNYERDLLLNLGYELGVSTAEWTGHKHEPIPDADNWIYIVQYLAGAEGWNCTETNSVIFYSQSYSYRATVQASGRIDRINTPFVDLYYFHLRSKSFIDNAIKQAYDRKQNFNEPKVFVS